MDHANGRADRPEDYEDGNLQTLCKSCHSRKTWREFGAANGVALKEPGCDESGLPTDPEHPWNS